MCRASRFPIYTATSLPIPLLVLLAPSILGQPDSMANYVLYAGLASLVLPYSLVSKSCSRTFSWTRWRQLNQSFVYGMAWFIFSSDVSPAFFGDILSSRTFSVPRPANVGEKAWQIFVGKLTST